MEHLRVAIGLALAALAFTMIGSSAEAADETATSSFSMIPRAGKLSNDVPKAVNWHVEVEVKAPFPDSPLVTPMQEIRADLPNEMSFNPDPDMPVCPDSKIGPSTNLSVPPDTAIGLCPDSVIGNGTAEHYLARINDANGPTLRDAVVVVFNGGRNSEGLPRIKVFGYSAGAATGIYMEGILKDGNLNVKIPPLPFDSATARFKLDIPGSTEENENRRGQDPDYVRTTCSTGEWQGQVSFLLGPRDTAGNPTAPATTISAPPLSIPCTASAGSAKLKALKVKGPSRVKRGAKGTYKVTLRNTGDSTARGLKVSTAGRGVSGKAVAPDLAPGKSKTVKVKVRFSRKGSVKTSFKVSSRNGGSDSVRKIVKVG